MSLFTLVKRSLCYGGSLVAGYTVWANIRLASMTRGEAPAKDLKNVEEMKEPGIFDARRRLSFVCMVDHMTLKNHLAARKGKHLSESASELPGEDK